MIQEISLTHFFLYLDRHNFIVPQFGRFDLGYSLPKSHLKIVNFLTKEVEDGSECGFYPTNNGELLDASDIEEIYIKTVSHFVNMLLRYNSLSNLEEMRFDNETYLMTAKSKLAELGYEKVECILIE